MKQDRDYYRSQPSAFLIEEARRDPHNPELCIALAERLEDAVYDTAEDLY
jgi:hypothetical protein